MKQKSTDVTATRRAAGTLGKDAHSTVGRWSRCQTKPTACARRSPGPRDADTPERWDLPSASTWGPALAAQVTVGSLGLWQAGWPGPDTCTGNRGRLARGRRATPAMPLTLNERDYQVCLQKSLRKSTQALRTKSQRPET